MIGFISHIVADSMTHMGVPLLYPLKWKFRMPLTFRTGSRIELAAALLPFLLMAGLYVYYGDYPIPIPWA